MPGAAWGTLPRPGSPHLARRRGSEDERRCSPGGGGSSKQTTGRTSRSTIPAAPDTTAVVRYLTALVDRCADAADRRAARRPAGRWVGVASIARAALSVLRSKDPDVIRADLERELAEADWLVRYRVREAGLDVHGRGDTDWSRVHAVVEAAADISNGRGSGVNSDEVIAGEPRLRFGGRDSVDQIDGVPVQHQCPVSLVGDGALVVDGGQSLLRRGLGDGRGPRMLRCRHDITLPCGRCLTRARGYSCVRRSTWLDTA